MARAVINVNVGGVFQHGNFEPSIVGGSVSTADDVVQATALVVADTAVLVEDGDSPDPEHVDTLNEHVTALNNAVVGLDEQVNGDVAVVWATDRVTTLSQLKAALAQVIVAAQGGYGGLTP